MSPTNRQPEFHEEPPAGRNGDPPRAVTSSDSHAVLAADLARTREALRELLRVTCYLGEIAPVQVRQVAINKAWEALGPG